LIAIPAVSNGQDWIAFFLEGEGDCTSEKGAGQFSIFGAVEEKGGGESWGEFGDGARASQGL